MPPTEPKSNSSLRDNYTHRGTFGDFLNAEIKLGRNPSFVSVAYEQALRERVTETYTELDALIAHLYSLTREEFSYILDTFPVLRRKELAAFGEYQSKRKALEEYERFQPNP